MHTSKIKQVTVGRRAREDENLPNNWEILDINKLVVPKNKTIFMFGGNTTNRPEAANGNAKIIESLLPPEERKQINILSNNTSTINFRGKNGTKFVKEIS